MKKTIKIMSLAFILMLMFSITAVKANSNYISIETVDDYRYSFTVDEPSNGLREGTLIGDNTITFEGGSDVTLIAREFYGYTFSHWFDVYENSIITADEVLILSNASTDYIIEPVYDVVEKQRLEVNTFDISHSFEVYITQPTLGTIEGIHRGTTLDIMVESGSSVMLTAIDGPNYNFVGWFDPNSGITDTEHTYLIDNIYSNEELVLEYQYEFNVDIRVVEVGTDTVEIFIRNYNNDSLKLEFSDALLQDPICTTLTDSIITLSANSTDIYVCNMLDDDTEYNLYVGVYLDDVYQGNLNLEFSTYSTTLSTGLLNLNSNTVGAIFYYEDALGRQIYSTDTLTLTMVHGYNVQFNTSTLFNDLSFLNFTSGTETYIFNTFNFNYSDIMGDFNLTANYGYDDIYISVSSEVTLNNMSMSGDAITNIIDNPIYGIYKNDTNVTLSTPSLNLDGYIFEHWYDYDTETILSTSRTNFNLNLNKDYNIQSVYRESNEYQLILGSNTGDNSDAELEFHQQDRSYYGYDIETLYTEQIPMSIRARDLQGYEFLYWFDEVNLEYYYAQEFNDFIWTDNQLYWIAHYEKVTVPQYNLSANTNISTGLTDITLVTDTIGTISDNPINIALDEGSQITMSVPLEFSEGLTTYQFQYWYDNTTNQPLSKNVNDNIISINNFDGHLDVTAIYVDTVQETLISKQFLYKSEPLEYVYSDLTSITIQTSLDGVRYNSIYTTNTNTVIFNFSTYLDDDTPFLFFRLKNNDTNEFSTYGMVTHKPSTKFYGRSNGIGIGSVVYKDTFSSTINNQPILHDKSNPNGITYSLNDTHMLVHYTLEDDIGNFQLGYANQVNIMYDLPIEEIISMNNGELDGYFIIPTKPTQNLSINSLTPYINNYQTLALGVYTYRVNKFGADNIFPDSVVLMSRTPIEYTLSLNSDHIRVGKMARWTFTRNTQEIYSVYNFHMFSDFRQSGITNQVLNLNNTNTTFEYIVDEGLNVKGNVKWDISSSTGSLYLNIPTNSYSFVITQEYSRHTAIGVEDNVGFWLERINMDGTMGRVIIIGSIMILLTLLMAFKGVGLYPIIGVNAFIISLSAIIGLIDLWFILLIIILLLYFVFIKLSKKDEE